MNVKSNIKKKLFIVCCLLTSILSVNKLEALTYNSYLRLNGSDTNLSTGYIASVAANSQLTFVSSYYLEDTGGLDYYLTTTLKFCSTGYLNAYNDDDAFLVSISVKNIGTCKVKTYTGTLYEIKWVRYLPVVSGSNVATANVYVKTSKYSYTSFYQFVSTDLTVQTAQVYEQQQTLEKQDKTNEKLDDLSSSLKNSDVDSNSSFFSNFTTQDHGISGIINAPLRAINKLTSACQPVTFSLLDEPIELPCGDTLFWNKEGVQSFRLIWNILVGGPILFLLLKKLFKVVESLKNPDDDRIEVIDL